MRCVIHGSFRKHFDLIAAAHRTFTEAGIEVLAPMITEIAGEHDGFVIFDGEQGLDPRMIELLYLRHLKHLGMDGFSYFVNPEGYLGRSASYELGIAQVTNIPCFFSAPLADHPAFVHRNAIWSPENLATFVRDRGELPMPHIMSNEEKIYSLWQDLMVPGSTVATGGIIEYAPPKSSGEKEILLVRTHKWKDRWSVVGGKVRRHEQLQDALRREIFEETGLRAGVGTHLATFDQIKNSGYYLGGMHHVFVDFVSRVGSKRVRLNEEAQEYAWMPAKIALRDLPIEPNARHIIELYASRN